MIKRPKELSSKKKDQIIRKINKKLRISTALQ